MNNETLDKNLLSLSKKNIWVDPEKSIIDDTVSESGKYTSVRISRSGHIIPCYTDGMSSNSIYDPVKEAQQIIGSLKPDSFIFFAGIGGGFHIREFLRTRPNSYCAVSESSLFSFRSLIELIDLSDIFQDPRVSIFPDCTSVHIQKQIPLSYLPALHGDFALYSSRTWQDRNKCELAILETHIKSALYAISSDYSVQAHFGKIWFRNALINLEMAAESECTIPCEDTKKIAIVAAAGPSLEDVIPELKTYRSDFTIFSTDTAFSTLLSSGLIPDYFISIDAQAVSVSHAFKGFTPEMNVIVDICGNPDIALQARKYGSNLIFVAGGHPFAAYASLNGRIPRINTSSGTVTVAALDVAYALGYSNVRLAGADFAYTNGKPYARGTYLEDIYSRNTNRYAPMEHLYSTLMFRTPVHKHARASKITYSTAILDSYSTACREYLNCNKWTPGVLRPFPLNSFLRQYMIELRETMALDYFDKRGFATLLPFFAWYRGMASRSGIQWNMSKAFQLALELIARYTKIS